MNWNRSMLFLRLSLHDTDGDESEVRQLKNVEYGVQADSFGNFAISISTVPCSSIIGSAVRFLASGDCIIFPMQRKLWTDLSLTPSSILFALKNPQDTVVQLIQSGCGEESHIFQSVGFVA